MFDGVHKGHQEILSILNQEAKRVNGESVLLTFSPHPRIALQANTDLKLLTTLDEKIEKLKKLNLNHLIIQPFTPEFSKLSALEFVQNFLINSLGMHTLVIGHDHHFGKNREGNFENLKKWATQFDFNLKQLPVVENDGIAISSTKIRNALLDGDLTYTKIGLNENYSVTGKVVEGDKIGRTIGFPTANITVLDAYKLIPSDGAFAVKIEYNRKAYLGMANIGIRPTINGIERRFEVNIFDFNENIYNKSIKIIFLEKIRNEKKFNSLEELKNDLSQTKKYVLETYNL